MEEYKRIKWHPAFYGGMELELRDYKDNLIFESEHELSKEPVRMDLLIVKKRKDIKIENPIGVLFRKHNIIEYKSPDDELNINDLYKVIGYAGLYKGTSTSANAVDVRELTISLFRYRYPRALFKQLEQLGARIKQPSSGVYYVEGIINLPLQIVVIRELEYKKHTPLTILTTDADAEEIKTFVEFARDLELSEDKTNVEALLEVSVPANMNLYERLRREDKIVCEALKILMKDDIDEAIAEKIAAIAEKDEAIAEKDATIAEKDAAIAEKNEALAEKDAEISALKAEVEKLKKQQK